MTREEAIKEFKRQQSLCMRNNEWYEALCIAVEALESEPMREATQEERDGVDQYIDSIAEPKQTEKSCKNCKHNGTDVCIEYCDDHWMHCFEPKQDDVPDTNVGEPDCISREAVHDLLLPWLNDYLLDETREILETIDYKIEDLASVQPKQRTEHWKDFVLWVAEEIFDENWEYNKDAFAEIACRKLEKLGIVRANGDKWELVESEVQDADSD